ncbi:MAG: phosphomannomutase/phosphoglucomutase [Candidatus Fermentithermobacillus carboniphilus]|uniref:Phosphomannomutase/phosphoglucomutase n=1 Tax=Candidatus Fermentithermobacillus carboniphilus TaxID=3085328 RepID=A0AAT9L9P6_9FIRM|nr:MAG: phosphomannomutase/phosphoglucomutase [Candidatus Fermentithermobacillus carboniphilus]
MTTVNPRIFREYDIRGLVGEDLTEKTVHLVALAYGTFLKRHGVSEAILGRDNRPSSYAYSRAVMEGLLETGIDVIDIGMVTTPVFYFSRIKYGVEGGVMVTGSHNPPEFNGFKLAFGPDTLYGDGIHEIRKIAEEGIFSSGSGVLSQKDPVPDYVNDIARRVKLGPKKVLCVVDAGNGAAGPIARKVFSAIGADFVEMFFEPDGTFPNHHPDPTRKENMQALIAKVKDIEADLGIAFDGDADRIGVVDRNGRLVWGDELQTIFWREILKKHPGALALIEVKCSQALVDVVERLGGRPEFTRTGHSLIKARMRETGALFTGEMSGHMFFSDEYYGFDDALYAATRLLRILTHSQESLEDFLAEVPRYYSTPEVRVFCPDETKFEVVNKLAKDFSRKYEVITVDGVRVLFPGGWGLVRASNTQPALVLRAESKTQEELEDIKRLFEEKLGGYPEVGAIEWD